MSGIVGIYYLNGRPVAQEQLSQIADCLMHRGADDKGIWIDQAVGFGHRMLWTTPESLGEKLPATNHQSGLTITADARIDNRDELLSQLGLRHRRDLPDSQIILAAYERWGEACLLHLIGDFAFAIWDTRQQRLFCGRDPMGVKPFYYYRSSTQFIFASEVKAILCCPEVPKDLDEMRIAQHLAGVLEEKVRTFYQHVSRLPAAHGLIISPEGQRIWSYWSPETRKELRLKSDQHYAEAFGDLFVNTVEGQLRSAFRVGSMLSGGLDSSSIACIARNALARSTPNPQFPTVSAIFPSLAEQYPEIDERSYIHAVVETGGFDPHYVHADQFSPLESRNLAHWHLDGPSLAPNLYMDWLVFRSAHEQGVRVLFSGQDGDSTVGYGHEYLTVLARQGRWLKLYQESKQLAKVFYGASVSASFLMWEYGFQSLIPSSIWNWRSRLQSAIGTPQPKQVSKLIHPAFARRLGLEDYLQEREDRRNRFHSVRAEHASHLTNGIMEYTLETLDHLAAAFSLEMRYPFCDRRMVEFCVAMPASQRLQNGWTRSIQRRGMAGVLPDLVQWRPDKGNLSSNFKQKMVAEQSRVDQAILEQGSLIENYVDLARLQSAYQTHGTALFMNDRDAMKLFPIVTLSGWLADTQKRPIVVH
jgi:asparagine synthase (glutamine-hydrolysing)